MTAESLAHGQALGRLERVRLAPPEGEGLRPRDMGGERDQRRAIVHQPRERRAGPIPFEHGELRRVQRRPLAIAENVCESKDLRLARGDELLHREFGRCVKPCFAGRAVRADEAGAEPVQVGLVAGRGLQGGGIDLDEVLGLEPAAGNRGDAGPQDSRGRRASWRSRLQNGGGAERTQGTPGVTVESRAMPSGLWRQNQYKARRQRRDPA